jgi:Tfp pilus assembly protein PilE
MDPRRASVKADRSALVSVLVVILLVGLLATISVPSFLG